MTKGYNDLLNNEVNITPHHNPATEEQPNLLENREGHFLNLPDREIWVALQSGDRKALGYVYNQYVDHLYRFGYQLSQDRELVRDCIQDIFIAISKEKKYPQLVHSIRSYLFKALYREIMFKLRGRRRFQLTGSPETFDAFGIDICTESRMIDQQDFAEKIERVKKAMNTLSEKQKQTILHHFRDGFSYEEIAYIMDIKHKNTVAKLMKRALQTLKEKVGLSLSGRQ